MSALIVPDTPVKRRLILQTMISGLVADADMDDVLAVNRSEFKLL
jgi:hypothetical protein